MVGKQLRIVRLYTEIQKNFIDNALLVKTRRLGLPFIWIQKTSRKYPRISELATYLILGYPTQYWSTY
jgi:hypothetical protein